jgi:hypothetical protein
MKCRTENKSWQQYLCWSGMYATVWRNIVRYATNGDVDLAHRTTARTNQMASRGKMAACVVLAY